MVDNSQMVKAIKIAFIDGFTQLSTSQWYVGKHKSQQVVHSRKSLLDIYTTDLNYLMPIAVKVLREINKQDHRKDDIDLFNAYCNLHDTYLELILDPNNQYTELFNSLYEAVKLLENE
jgi:hypothetical protein